MEVIVKLQGVVFLPPIINLIQLKLQVNQITGIYQVLNCSDSINSSQSGSFLIPWSPNLKLLQINSNRFIHIPKMVDENHNLSKVEACLFGYNRLQSVEFGTFQGMTNIKEIAFSGTTITTTVEHMSIPATVTSIRLEFNAISSINPDFMSSLPNIEYFRCYGNLLTNIIIPKLKMLMFLDFRSNYQLDTFVINAEVPGLPQLETLVLSSTSLNMFTKETFMHMSNLKTLYLSDTYITHIEDISSIYGNALPAITITQIDCGVAMSWAKYQSVSYPGASCNYPQRFQGHCWDSLSDIDVCVGKHIFMYYHCDFSQE